MASLPPLRGGGGEGAQGSVAEVDEAFMGRKAGTQVGAGTAHKITVLSLVHRESGQARSLESRKPIAPTSCRSRSGMSTGRLMSSPTKQHTITTTPSGVEHDRVNHIGGEYVRGRIHTNTLEALVRRRGMSGVYRIIDKSVCLLPYPETAGCSTGCGIRLGWAGCLSANGSSEILTLAMAELARYCDPALRGR